MTQSHDIFRRSMKIRELSSKIERLSREERSRQRRALLDQIATAKTETIRCIDKCFSPWDPLQHHQWHQKVEAIQVTDADAAGALDLLRTQVQTCRAANEPGTAASVNDPRMLLGMALDTPLWDVFAECRTSTFRSDAERVQFTVALLLLEVQLAKLIDLSRQWQDA